MLQELFGETLGSYVDATFEKGKKEYSGFGRAISLFLAHSQEVPTVRSWCVGDLDDRSDLSGDYDLLYDDAHLVGVKEDVEGNVFEIAKEIIKKCEIQLTSAYQLTKKH